MTLDAVKALAWSHGCYLIVAPPTDRRLRYTLCVGTWPVPAFVYASNELQDIVNRLDQIERLSR